MGGTAPQGAILRWRGALKENSGKGGRWDSQGGDFRYHMKLRYSLFVRHFWKVQWSELKTLRKWPKFKWDEDYHFYIYVKIDRIEVKDNDLEIYIYTNYFEKLKRDFEARFSDILSLHVPSCVFNPFENIEYPNIRPSIEEELIEIQNNI